MLSRADLQATLSTQVTATTQSSDVPEWERNLVSFTLVADGDGTRQIGRAAFHPAEFAGRTEAMGRHLHRITTVWHRYPGDLAETEGTPITVGAKPGERVHRLNLHGSPRGVVMPQEDGSTYFASDQEVAKWLTRRPSVRRLRRQDWIYLDSCWTGGVHGGNVDVSMHAAASLHPVPDPLADIPVAQVVANGTRKRVRAADRSVAYSYPLGPLTSRSPIWFTVYSDARGRPGRLLEFWPEPLDGELADLARTAGLHSSPGPVPGDTLDRTLRLVRALRQTFGPGIGPGLGQDPSYDDLLRGVGALETMRQNDPLLNDMGPFTLELFQRAALANLRDHGGGVRPLDAGAYRDLLARAAGAPPGTRLTDFVRVPRLTEVAQQIQRGEDPQAAAVRVLRLDPGATVGPAEISRFYWAQVKSAEWFASLPDADGVAVAALHLPGPDPSQRDELKRLATGAIAAGRDPSDLVELAAFHLEELGALDARTLTHDAHGRPNGRNWGPPMPPGTHLDASVLGTLTQQPDGTYLRTGQERAPWALWRNSNYVVVAEDAGKGRTWITLPGGRRIAVPHAEAAELIARDAELIGRDDLTTDVVLALSRSGAPQSTAPQPTTSQPTAPPSLRLAVVHATGRPTWESRGTAGLDRSGDTGPVSLVGTPGTDGTSFAADWIRTHPLEVHPEVQQPSAATLGPSPCPIIPSPLPPSPSRPGPVSPTPPSLLLRHRTPPSLLLRHRTPPSLLLRHRTPPSLLLRHRTPRPLLLRHRTPPSLLLRHRTPPRLLLRHRHHRPCPSGIRHHHPREDRRQNRAPPRVGHPAAARAPPGRAAQHPRGRPAPPVPPARIPGVPRLASVGDDIDERRPPRLDRDLPPAPVSGGGPVSFTDRSRLPAYMGGIGALLPGLPRGVLSRSYRLGQSDRALRGGDGVAREIGARLGHYHHLGPRSRRQAPRHAPAHPRRRRAAAAWSATRTASSATASSSPTAPRAPHPGGHRDRAPVRPVGTVSRSATPTRSRSTPCSGPPPRPAGPPSTAPPPLSCRPCRSAPPGTRIPSGAGSSSARPGASGSSTGSRTRP